MVSFHFEKFASQAGFRWTFIIAAICGVSGIFVTYFFVPDMTGIDLEDEDAKFLTYLKENGWEGEVGEYGDRRLVSRSNEEKTGIYQ
jgi:hypothetical protein